MRCDIIMPVWNQFEFTRDCIEHIARNTAYPYRLIVVDNASDQETKGYLESLKSSGSIPMELIRNETNLGFIKAANQGMRISDAPYICLMNNDTVPASGWLERMVEFAESHKDAGLINPQCGGHGNIPMENYARSLIADKGKYMEMNQCQGFCMLIKREVIDKIGYLDEAFGIGGYDDTDYSMRAHKAGYRSVAIRDSYVYHRLHASFDKAGDREDWVRRNQKIYYSKWGRHLRVGIAAGLDAADKEALSRLVLLSYGLAREWSWVHLWVNSKLGRAALKDAVKGCLESNGLAPHQNIKIGYFDLPRPIFSAVMAAKLIERLLPRKRDKIFDAVIALDCNAAAFLKPFAKLTAAQVLSPVAGQRPPIDEGRRLAEDIRKARDRYHNAGIK